MLRRLFLAGCVTLPPLASSQPPTAAQIDTSASNLMLVLRPFGGGKPRQSEVLRYLGPGMVTLDDGKQVEVQSAWYEYIGDMQLRFVFDGENTMPNAIPDDLRRLGLTANQAVELSVRNIRRVYGAPKAVPFAEGLFEVDGKSIDLISSYFLDKQFWRELETKYPEGVVVAVPKRSGILFAPASHAAGVAKLQQSVGYLYRSSERLRVSSALYLFKSGAWSLFQNPQP